MLPWLLLIILSAMFIYDRFYSDDNVLRNYPVLGHWRTLLELIGPSVRRHVAASDSEEAPFSREERDWIERSARGGDAISSFGCLARDYGMGAPVLRHAEFLKEAPAAPASSPDAGYALACAKTIGEAHGRKNAWRPASLVNISAMSFGALSGKAVESLNLGAKLADCWHNTGEGGLTPYHRNGADVIFQLGAGYFGARDMAGNFSMDLLQRTVSSYRHVRGVEIKLSQGSEPGRGGLLPAAKVTDEIAFLRGVAPGRDCQSPAAHKAFSDIPSLLDFIESVASATGLPVGIKSAVSGARFWKELASAMRESGKGPDWISIDGGEGGSGAAPSAFMDCVSLPFYEGFTRAHKAFRSEKMAEKVLWAGSGRLGLPQRAAAALCLGADIIAVGREAMLAIGCIQARRCHDNRCPSGVASQEPRLQYGIEPRLQAERFARYCRSLRRSLLELARACGHEHPSQFTAEDMEIGVRPGTFKTLAEAYGASSSCPPNSSVNPADQ